MTKSQISKYTGGEISVYCTTYNKYNGSRLDGAWLNLEAISDVSEFFDVCRALHSDERDPEFMFTEYQGFPSWLYGESMCEKEVQELLNFAHATPAERARIACEDDDDEQPAPAYSIVEYSEKAIALVGDTKPISKDLKALGGRFNPRLTCGAGWIFPATKRAQLEQLLSGADITAGPATGSKPATPKQDDKQHLEEYIDEMRKVWKDKGMLDFHRKEFSSAVRLENGALLVFEKPRIETRFCFGYSDDMTGDDHRRAMKAEKAARTESYFLSANLNDFDRQIKGLEKGSNWDEIGGDYYGKTWYLCRVSYNSQTGPLNLFRYTAVNEYELQHYPHMYPGEYVKMSDKDRATILAGLKHERDKFEKRLQAYLKRYGTEKLHTWTYWQDE